MKILASVSQVMKGRIGLNIEAATRKHLLEISSFRYDFQYLDTINEFVLGRYENSPHNFVVFTDKGIRIVSGDLEDFVSFNQLLYVSLPVLESANWNVLVKSNRSVRTIELTLTTGDVFSIPVMNETSIVSFHPEAESAQVQMLDIFQVFRFLNKVAFFQNKRRRKQDQIAVVFASLAGVFALAYLVMISTPNSEILFWFTAICLVAWLYLALHEYVRRH